MIQVWGKEFDASVLSDYERDYLETLPSDLPTVQWIWDELDRVWDAYALNNLAPFSDQDVASFYSHPVWIMNGIFTECDPISLSHREKIANYFYQNNIMRVADYGGGSGCLASTFCKGHPEVRVDIIEPYPALFFKKALSNLGQIRFFPKFQNQNYEAVISQDVLEHVENPIEIAFQMASHWALGGKVIFANCFEPCIKCHLPKNFYLRYTFKVVMKAMGLTYVGHINGAQHALIFEKRGDLKLKRALVSASALRVPGTCLNVLALLHRSLRRTHEHENTNS